MIPRLFKDNEDLDLLSPPVDAKTTLLGHIAENAFTGSKVNSHECSLPVRMLS